VSRTSGMSVTLEPFERRSESKSLSGCGYTKVNQLYPVRLGLKTGEFVSEITHDFYVGVAHFAKNPPSLTHLERMDSARPMLMTAIADRQAPLRNQPWTGEKDLSRNISMYDLHTVCRADVTTTA